MEELAVNKTILVVDDEDDVRESVREVLRDEGYRVIDTARRHTSARLDSYKNGPSLFY